MEPFFTINLSSLDEPGVLPNMPIYLVSNTILTQSHITSIFHLIDEYREECEEKRQGILNV